MTETKPSAPQWLKDWALRLTILGVITLVIWPHPDADQAEAGKRQVLAILRDPDSAIFTDVQTFHPTPNGGRVIVCGYVNSRNRFGGMTGSQQFIVDGIAQIEDRGNSLVVRNLWEQKCTDG